MKLNNSQGSRRALQTQPDSSKALNTEKSIQIVESLKGLTAGFLRVDFSLDNIVAYTQELMDIDIRVIDAAITKARRNLDVCPSISKLLEICRGVEADMKKETIGERIMLPEARPSDAEVRSNLLEIRKIIKTSMEKSDMSKILDSP